MRRPGRLARLGIRGRLLATSVLAVGAALAVGGALLYLVLTTSITRTVQSELRSIATEVAVLVDSGRLPDPVPVSGAQVVQVLDGQGRVVDGSVTADRLTPLVTEQERLRALAGEVVAVPGNRSGLSGQLQVAAVEAGPTGARVTIVAAAPTADLETSTRTLRTLLLILFPLLLLALGVIAWLLIGAALRPVEALRRGSERIDESSSETERLPLPQAEDELRALATTLNAMLDRVASARRTQRAFVADAAHELRSPLASMRTQLEVAERLGEGGALPAELLSEVHRLANLVEDLLLLARTDDAAPPVRPRVVDLAELLQAVASRYADARVPVRVEQAATATSRTLPTGHRVVAVPDDLVRALTNLVDNAVRHAATSVTISFATAPQRVEVCVRDDGSGIPPSDLERVFDRFTRLDDARDRDSGGTGLGLPITRELLRRWGGTVRLEGAAPGVRAVISLPAQPDQRAGLG